MRFVHLSDLHLGKKVNGFNLIDDQKYILTKIINVIDEEKPEAVVIAGDIYDTQVPPAEAVSLFDEFLTKLSKKNLHVLVISGNHDSAERLAFGNKLMSQSGIHISPVYKGEIEPITLEDEFGKVNFYMLPFVKPAHVRSRFPEDTIESFTDAIKVAVKGMNVDFKERNVMVSHQFVTGATRSDSESVSVGGLDNVDAIAYEGFDYVALGHIHGPQNIGLDSIRYCGTPLKYSFSEEKHNKSVTIVEMGEKGNVAVRTVDLEPQHDMKTVKGECQELIIATKGAVDDDYIRVVLTDEEDVIDAVGILRAIYPNLMELKYDNKRTRESKVIDTTTDVDNKTPLELFGELYELQNNQPMSKTQTDYAKELMESIWEG